MSPPLPHATCVGATEVAVAWNTVVLFTPPFPSLHTPKIHNVHTHKCHNQNGKTHFTHSYNTSHNQPSSYTTKKKKGEGGGPYLQGRGTRGRIFYCYKGKRETNNRYSLAWSRTRVIGFRVQCANHYTTRELRKKLPETTKVHPYAPTVSLIGSLFTTNTRVSVFGVGAFPHH